MTSYRDYNIHGVHPEMQGEVRTLCPECSHTRKKSNEKCLAVNMETSAWFCHHCGWSGSLKKSDYKRLELPDFTQHLTEQSTKHKKNMLNYFESRGLSEQTISQEGIYPSVDSSGLVWYGFPFYQDDKVVNIKFRTDDKQFRQTAGGHRTFYRLDKILDKDTRHVRVKSVVITEGEIDALSYLECGIDYAISVPDGALNPDAKNVSSKMQFVDNTIHLFDGVEKIYLALDADSAGRRMREELARRFGKDRCSIVQYPDGCKDANDVLLQHGAQILYGTLASSVDYPLDGVRMLSDSSKQVLDIYENGFPQGVYTGAWSRFDNLIRWFPGHLTVVTGIPSHGKSNFVDNLIVNLARNNGWKSAVFSPENPTPEMWIIRLLEIATGETFFGSNRISADKISGTIDALSQYFFLISPDDDYSIEKITATSRALLRRFGINVLVIDPWNNLEVKSKGGENETSYTARILVKLRSFARQTGIHIILIAHPRKMQKDNTGNYEIPTAYDISGSAHFYNVADNILSVYREFLNADNDVSTTHVHVQKVKTKYSGMIGSARFDFDKSTQKYTELA